MPKRTSPSPTQPRVKRQTPKAFHAELVNQQQTQQQHQEQQRQSLMEKDSNYIKIQREFDVSSSKTWLFIGQCAATFGLHSLAVQAYDSSLRHTPDKVDSIVGLSKALKLQDPTLGLKQSTELILSSIQRYQHLSNEPALWKELCETHLAASQFEEAHQAISRALALNGTDPELLLTGAECLIKLSNFQYATHILHSVLSAFTNKPHLNELEVNIVRDAHYKLAYLASLEDNVKVAVSEIKIALSLPPHPPSKIEEQATLWAFLITLKERTGDVEIALKTAQDAIYSVGSVPKLLIAQAYLLLLPNSKIFDPLTAISLLESAVNQEVLAHGPNVEGDFLVWYLLGKAHTAIESPREAYNAFQIALRLGPSSPLPWLAVGSLYLKMGQLPDALAAYSQAARLMVDDTSTTGAAASATAWDGLSCVYERCDDQAHDAADACLRAAACFRAAGDLRAATQSEQRAHSLTAGARGEAPIPSLRDPPETPIVLVRELVSGSKQSLANNAQQQQQAPTAQVGPPLPCHQQPQRATQVSPRMTQEDKKVSPGLSVGSGEAPRHFHHIPIPRGSLASRSNTPDLKQNEKQQQQVQLSHQPTPAPQLQQPQQPSWSPPTQEAPPNGFHYQPPLQNPANPRSLVGPTLGASSNVAPPGFAAHAPPLIQPPQHPPQNIPHPGPGSIPVGVPNGAAYIQQPTYAYSHAPPTSAFAAQWR